ncbi:MAG: hypothetical protein P8K78_08160 [Pirellulales bacterium]|nr:hypothetical protein [Pirellulales bacterium]
MPRRICILLLLVASINSPAFCQQAGDPSIGAATPAATSPRPHERRLDDSAMAEAKLKKIIPRAEFDDDPFDIVVATIEDVIKFPIVLDSDALNESIDMDNALVTGRFTNMSVENMLNLILRQLGPELTHTARHGVILITTTEAAIEQPCTRLYDVRDLVTFIDDEGKPYSDPEDLITAIISNFDLDSWDEFGGEGQITPVEGTGVDVLVVSHTPQMHAQISKFLTALRGLRHSEEYEKGPRRRVRRPKGPAVPSPFGAPAPTQ